MKEQNLILRSWLQQKKIFVDNLIISRKCPTKDSVHDLRVAVKKMRSYLRLNEDVSKEEWRNLFAEIKELFKCFGRLRDFDMSLELTRKSERKWQISLPVFKEYLVVNKSLTRRWAKKAANNFNERQTIFNPGFIFFDNLTPTEASEKIIALCSEKIRRVKRLKKHFHTNAHEIRKQLKDVLYWLKICPKEFLEQHIDVKKIDTVLKYLGTWQDQFILKSKMKQYAKELANKIEKETLVELEKKITAIQRDQLAKAEKKLGEIGIKKATGFTQSPHFVSAPDGS